MSNEVYFGEMDCRRFDRLEVLLTDISTNLEVLAQQTTNKQSTPVKCCHNCIFFNNGCSNCGETRSGCGLWKTAL